MRRYRRIALSAMFVAAVWASCVSCNPAGAPGPNTVSDDDTTQVEGVQTVFPQDGARLIVMITDNGESATVLGTQGADGEVAVTGFTHSTVDETTEVESDDQGRPTRVIMPSGTELTLTYNADNTFSYSLAENEREVYSGQNLNVPQDAEIAKIRVRRAEANIDFVEAGECAERLLDNAARWVCKEAGHSSVEPERSVLADRMLSTPNVFELALTGCFLSQWYETIDALDDGCLEIPDQEESDTCRARIRPTVLFLLRTIALIDACIPDVAEWARGAALAEGLTIEELCAAAESSDEPDDNDGGQTPVGLVNGSFEQGYPDASAAQLEVFHESSGFNEYEIPGWSVDSGVYFPGDRVYWVGPASDREKLDGDHFLGLGNTGVVQEVSTDPGRQYTLTFYVAGTPGAEYGIELDVVIGNGASGNEEWLVELDTADATVTDLGWEQVSIQFVGPDESDGEQPTMIQFKNGKGGGGAPYIDAVELTSQ